MWPPSWKTDQPQFHLLRVTNLLENPSKSGCIFEKKSKTKVMNLAC